jgi:uncharacterized protein GlcG (DUF336 family)
MARLVAVIVLLTLSALFGRDSVVAKEKEDDAADGGRLTGANVEAVFAACQETAGATPSPLRGGGKFTKMWCAVVNREGELRLIRATDTGEEPGPVLSSDAWRGSIEIAIAKAYTAVAFSSNDLALDSKTIGLLARPDGPGSTDPAAIGTNAGVASLFGIGNTNLYRPLEGARSLNPDDRRGAKHHGIVTFAGGQPVYDCTTHHLIGAVGVSGDGVDQDDAVAKGAVTGAGFCLTP